MDHVFLSRYDDIMHRGASLLTPPSIHASHVHFAVGEYQAAACQTVGESPQGQLPSQGTVQPHVCLAGQCVCGNESLPAMVNSVSQSQSTCTLPDPFFTTPDYEEIFLLNI